MKKLLYFFLVIFNALSCYAQCSILGLTLGETRVEEGNVLLKAEGSRRHLVGGGCTGCVALCKPTHRLWRIYLENVNFYFKDGYMWKIQFD